MDILVTGIKSLDAQRPLQQLHAWGYEPTVLHQFLFSKAQEVLDVGTHVDLMLLGGNLGGGRMDEDVAVTFAQAHPQIPSILLVYAQYRAVINRLNRVHPPYATRGFSEFSNLGREGIEYILAGHYHSWSLG